MIYDEYLTNVNVQECELRSVDSSRAIRKTNPIEKNQHFCWWLFFFFLIFGKNQMRQIASIDAQRRCKFCNCARNMHEKKKKPISSTKNRLFSNVSNSFWQEKILLKFDRPIRKRRRKAMRSIRKYRHFSALWNFHLL